MLNENDMKNEETIPSKKTTKGKKKLIDYLKALVQTEEFEEEVRKIRNKCGIPRDGYSYEKDGKKRYTSASVFIAW